MHCNLCCVKLRVDVLLQLLQEGVMPLRLFELKHAFKGDGGTLIAHEAHMSHPCLLLPGKHIPGARPGSVQLTPCVGSWNSAVLLAASRVSALMVWNARLGSAASAPRLYPLLPIMPGGVDGKGLFARPDSSCSFRFAASAVPPFCICSS